MPRSIPYSFEKLLARPDKRIESHTTLQIYIEAEDFNRSYYMASAALTSNGVSWLPYLRKSSQIRTSLTKAADAAVVELFNADLALGVEQIGRAHV